MIYKIILYDQLSKVQVIFVLPERRKAKGRPRGKYTIVKWIKSIMGNGWWEKNKYRVGIIGVEKEL